MRELVGRLSGLDPTATETLRVIEYFDTLVEGHVGLEAFLRGAAVLSGAPAGLVVPERRLALRVDAGGRRTGARTTALDGWSSHPIGAGGTVWIERDGPAHANDRMVLERLAMGVAVTLDRTSLADADVGGCIEQLIDIRVRLDERLRAADRLHLHRPVRVIAAAPDDPIARRAKRSTLVSTVAGVVFAVLDDAEQPAPERAGIGRTVPPTEVAAAWTEALVALRLTSARRPVVAADELGALTVLAAGVDAGAAEPPDVVALGRLVAGNPALLDTLDELAAHESVRGAAAALGVHHSTLQHRIAAVRAELGYDPGEHGGRQRMALALAVHRLTHTRFDS
ncbi:helix-turn-helix domain-containing protein [Pseudonocardia sp. TRM90224]|uniref:helix-turn-helix domain-containing protein n=1 Tax=Pseudonocardia sp. TRM90224 TaxID=2812678 RepID=UPI001E4DFB70|nr:helix-turn-helix domain-containing protein [Pseudonocardia sp. TRM90224]